jgi:hypothetical protein
MWAQAMEALGEGRGVRYGQGPERPDLPIMEPFSTRGAFTRELIELAEGVEDLEKLDNLSTGARCPRANNSGKTEGAVPRDPRDSGADHQDR